MLIWVLSDTSFPVVELYISEQKLASVVGNEVESIGASFEFHF